MMCVCLIRTAPAWPFKEWPKRDRSRTPSPGLCGGSAHKVSPGAALTSPSAADILQETPMNKLVRSAGVILLAAFPLLPLFPQGRDYGRSMVISQQGIVATSQTLASQAASHILATG